MKVRHGWSGEVRPNVWAKLDVELEEEDLRRILTAATLPEDTTLSTVTAFKLLEGEAEMLLTAKLVSQHGYEQGRGALLALKERKAKLMADLSKQRDKQ